jgi:ribulose-5-phosphate 4-epimerase/fuculose-1-phosphate aldolase
MAIRAAHPDHPHGVAYTKHAGSRWKRWDENIVITEIPTSRLLYGSRMTSIGHNLNREILRLRPDIGAVIHVHDDATISFFGSGGFKEVKVLSLDMPFILAKAPYYVPASLDVEADVGPVKDFIAETNTLVLLGHGVTALGRTISEAYHRLNSFTAEIRRNVGGEAASLEGHHAPLPQRGGGRVMQTRRRLSIRRGRRR